MDIVQIVASAVTLLAPYLAKVGDGMIQKAGEDTWDKMKALHQAIRGRFSAEQDDYALKTLQRLEEQPSAEGRQKALVDVLAEKAQTDPEFAQELKQLVQNTTQGKDVGQFLTQVYGGEVGKIININEAKDFTIN